MDFQAVREKPFSKRCIYSGVNLLQKRREEKDLQLVLRRKKDELKTKVCRMEERHKEFQHQVKLNTDIQAFEEMRADELVQKAEREMQEFHRLEEQKEQQLKELSKLKESKQELELELERLGIYNALMESAIELTPFSEKDSLVDYFENTIEFTNILSMKECEGQEQVNELREGLTRLLDEHSLRMQNYKNQLCLLETEHREVFSEAQEWEKEWNHILETSAKKTLQLGQIKMATLNLYEMTGATLNEEEGIGMSDTEKQLDVVQLFMHDNHDIIKAYQTVQKEDPEKESKEETLKHEHLPPIQGQGHTNLTGTDLQPRPPQKASPHLNQARSRYGRGVCVQPRDAFKDSVHTPRLPNTPPAKMGSKQTLRHVHLPPIQGQTHTNLKARLQQSPVLRGTDLQPRPRVQPTDAVT